MTDVDVVRAFYAAMAARDLERRWMLRDGRVVAAHFAIDTAAMLRVLGTEPPSSAE